MKVTEKVERLIFCAAPAWQVLQVAKALESSNDTNNLLFLISRPGETGNSLLEKGCQVIYGQWSGMFSSNKMSQAVDEQLSSARFSDIDIICSNHNSEGYEEIIDYCRSLGAERVVLVYPDMLYRSVISEGDNGSYFLSGADDIGIDSSVDDMFYKERAYPEGLSEEPLWNDFGAIFETTFLCNYECIHCPRNVADLDTSQSIDPQVFSRFIEDERIGHITLLGLGETLMNPRFDEISKIIASKKVPTAIVTNGSYVSSDKLAHLLNLDLTLIVSMDGAEEEIFGHLRKPSELGKIRENLKKLIDEHANIDVVFNTVVSVDNYHSVGNVVEMAADLGVKKVNLLNVLALEEKSGACHWFSSPESERMEAELDAQMKASQLGVEFVGKPSRPSLRTCLSPWNQMYVAMNGDVYPCSFIYRIPSDSFDEHFMGTKAETPLKAFKLGNLNKDSLSDIWNGPRVREVRRILLDSQHDVQLDLVDYLKLREETSIENPLDYCRTCLNRWNCAC